MFTNSVKGTVEAAHHSVYNISAVDALKIGPDSRNLRHQHRHAHMSSATINMACIYGTPPGKATELLSRPISTLIRYQRG